MRVKWAVPAIAVVLLALGLGCGGGGGDAAPAVQYTGSTEQSPITRDGVAKVLGTMGDYIPGCTAGGDGVVRAARGGAQSLPDQILGILLVAGRGDDLGSMARSLAAEGLEESIAGDCPGKEGRIRLVGEESGGDLDASIQFEGFCIEDSFSGEQITVDGDMKVGVAMVEVGGVSELNRATASSTRLTVKAGDGQSNTISFSGFLVDVGNPGGSGTIGSPDVVALASFAHRDDNTGTVVQLTGLNVSAYEDGTDQVVDLVSGRLYMPDTGYVDMSTPTPFQVNYSGDLAAGSFRASGTTGAVTITPQPGSPGVFAVDVDGEELDETLDCSALQSGLEGQL